MTHDTRSVPSPAGEKIKILVADDDLPTRVLLRAAITQWGYEVVEAGDGEIAWSMLKEKSAPRILILDWLMPKLDGIGLCMRIKNELDYHPYIILLTQMSGTANVTKGLEAGADEFLSKPFNMAELKSRLSVGIKIIGYETKLAKQETSGTSPDSKQAGMDEATAKHNDLTIMIASAIINLTYELNTVLNKICLMINAKSGDDAELRKQVDRVHSLKIKLEHLVEITNKPKSEHPHRPRFTTSDHLRDMINASLETCITTLNEVNIDVDVGKNIPDVLVDQSQLRQALIGIVINVARIIKQTPNKTIRVRISGNDANGQVCLTIECSGEKFTEDEFGKNLEESLKQSSFSEKLPCVKLSYDLLKKNHGCLDIAPGKENGLVFMITLPYGSQIKEGST